MNRRAKNVEFGALAAFVLVVVSAVWHVELTAVVIAVLAVTLLAPRLFSPLTRLWLKFGELSGAVVTRCILFIVFFAVVTPVGLVRRAMGRDQLRLKAFRKSADSAFTARDKCYTPRDMERQF